MMAEKQPIGRLIKKHHRQVTCCVKAPPKTGPTILAIAKVELIVPVQIARLWRGIIVVNITNPPAKTPEAPKPVTTLPAIRALDVGAKAQTKLPISNMPR